MARRGKRKNLSVLRFERDLGANLQFLHDELHTGVYAPEPYRHFTVYSAKPRQISAPSFRDVVVQHAIYSVVGPIFNATFLRDSYGCRVGGGSHRASDALQSAMRKAPDNAHILQMDIKKFYYSIDHDVLQTLIERKIKDRRFVALMLTFAKDKDERIGLPIGNLLSQLYALIYLNPLDHYIKRALGVRHYARYVDDMVVVADSKSEAHRLRAAVKVFLQAELRLTFSKWSIGILRRGANFVGFRTWRARRFVRKRTLHNFTRALRRQKVASLISLIGFACRTSTIGHFNACLLQSGQLATMPMRVRSRLAKLGADNNGIRKNKRPDGRDIPIQHWRPASG